MYEREPLPYYGGLVSFFRTPSIEIEQITEGLAVVAGVPIDNGVTHGRAQARFGPRAIREASLADIFEPGGSEEQNIFIDMVDGTGSRLKKKPDVADMGDFNVYPTDLMKTTESVIHGMTEVVKRGAFAVVLGGDHYITYPSFTGFAKGIAERIPNVRLGYIHIDSHTDFWDDFEPLGGRYNHGTMARRISENPMVAYKNMAWVGLNHVLSIDQARLKRDHNLKMMTYLDNRERGIEQVMREAMDVASDGTDAVYVSVDIDVIDGSESAGTGGPPINGIRAEEFLDAMGMLSRFKEMAAIDLCEVSPEHDHTGRTQMLASRGLINVLRPRLFDQVEVSE